MIDVTKNDSFISLTVRQSQLLQGDLILLRLSNWDRNTIFKTLIDWQDSDGLFNGRYGRLVSSSLSHGLERYVFYSHGHSNRVQYLLEWLGLEGLGRLTKSQLSVINCLRPIRNTHLLGNHWWELNEISFQVNLVSHFKIWANRKKWSCVCAWKSGLFIEVGPGELNLILQDDVVITLVNDLVLADLRLTWYVVRHWWKRARNKLIVFTWLSWHKISFRQGPRILVECKFRLNNSFAIALRNLDIDDRNRAYFIAGIALRIIMNLIYRA